MTSQNHREFLGTSIILSMSHDSRVSENSASVCARGEGTTAVQLYMYSTVGCYSTIR